MQRRLVVGAVALVLAASGSAAVGSPAVPRKGPATTSAPGPSVATAERPQPVMPAVERGAPRRGLRIVVDAPAGVLPRVTVKGPRGWRKTLTRSRTFQSAPRGTYLVRASTRRFAGGTAVPSVSRPKVRIGKKKGAQVRVGYDTVVSPATRVVPPTQVQQLTSNPDGTQVLETTGSPSAEVGSIMVSGVSDAAPNGLISRVEAVRQVDGAVQYTLSPALITDAFTELSFDKQVAVTLDSNAAQARGTAARASLPRLGARVSCDSGVDFTVDRSLDGQLALTFSGVFRADNPGASYLRAEASASLKAHVAATIEAAGTCAIPRTQIGKSIVMPPITFSIGPVPVVLVPTLKFYGSAHASLGTKGGVEVTATLGTKAWAQASVQGGVTSGFEPPTARLEQKITYPDDISGEVGGELSARLTTELYGVAGPHVEVNTGPVARFAPTKVPWLEAVQELSVDVGMNLEKCARLWGADLCVSFETEVEDIVAKKWTLMRREYLAAPAITTTQLPQGVKGQSYSARLSTRDDRGGRWNVVSGGLPGGIRLNGNTLTGTPTQAGTSSFTVRFTDNDGRSDDQSLTLGVLNPTKAEDLEAFRGTIARLPDGTAFYVDKRGGKHHVPDGGVYECLVAQGVPVKAATAADTGSMPTYEPAECVRAAPGNIIRTDNGDAYRVNSDWSRSWIPTGGDYMCLEANGASVVNGVPRYYVDDLTENPARATLDCYAADRVLGKVVRAADGSSWYVDLRGGKHHIPNGGTFDCIAAQRGTHAYRVPRAWLTQSEYEAAACVRAQPGNVIRHSDGDAYVVNSNWTKSWIPSAKTYHCFTAANGLVNNVPRYYISDLSSAGNAAFPGGNCILRRSDGAAYFINNEGFREWIPDTPTWDCEVGRGIKVLGPSNDLTNAIAEKGWHYCLNKANLRGKVLRHVEGDAYYIHPDDTKTWIPDQFTYGCRQRQGKQVVDTRWREYVNAFAGGEWDYCFDPATFHNTYIKHPDGDIHYVGPDGRRHYAATQAAVDCLQARHGTPRTVRWRDYIKRLPQGDWAVCGDTLRRNQNFDRGQWLRSGNGYRLVMQTDSNLVVYNPSGKAIWALGINSSRKHIKLHDNGCLASVRYDNEWDWSKGCGSNADRLVMQSDGNLVLYAGSKAVWATNTVGK